MLRGRYAPIATTVAAVLAVGIGCAVSEPISPEELGTPDATATGLGGANVAGASGTAGDGGQGTGGSNGGASATGIAGASGATGSKGLGGTDSSITSGQAGSADVGRGGTGGSNVSGQAGSGGGAGTGDSAGRGGATGAGGRGGAIGAGGRGGTGAAGGRGGTGAAGGRGGATGTAGGGGTPDAGTDAAPTVTFTDVYTNILVVSCSGSSCHNPGSAKGISFSSQSTAYTAVRNRVTPGNGSGSSFYSTVNSGSMPPGGPKLSAANLAKIKAWIDAGALNN